MKKTIKIYDKNGPVEKEIQHIPFRFILASALIVLETLAVLAIVIWCTINIPFFYCAAVLTQVFCVLKIINSDENPDYKVPWLLFVIVVPVVGFMIYFMFYDRKLSKRMSKQIDEVMSKRIKVKDNFALEKLEQEDRQAFLNAKLLCKLSGTNLYQNTKAEYFDMGEKMYVRMLEDLKKAEKFIFMEYFIIEESKKNRLIRAVVKTISPML